MVKCGIALALAAGGKAVRVRRCGERRHKLRVVVRRIAGLSCAKLPKVALRGRAGRHMDVVAVHDGVRGRYHYRLWVDLRDARTYLPVCVDRVLNLFLATPAYGRDDQGWVRNRKRRYDCHGSFFPDMRKRAHDATSAPRARM